LEYNASSFKNIIFDLGGVIINLSVAATFKAFAKASGKPIEEIAPCAEHQVFLDYEKGLITDEAFRDQVRALFGWKSTDDEFDACWNAMLLDIPMDRLQFLEKLKTTHRVFLLSNTNEIHLRKFNQILNNTSGQASMDYYFHKAYYSHHMKMRKPDTAIFEYLLKENNLEPAHTLFLDDNLSNLQGAAQTGIRTFHVKSPELIFSLF
jgi:glucose-1-phosphatase